MSDAAIRVSGLTKHYKVYETTGDRLKEIVTRTPRHRVVVALEDVSFELPRGATYGLIGQNGAGKSTALKIIANKLRASSGSVEVNGQVSSILELGTGFQESLTGRQNARLNALFVGYDPWEVDARLDQIVSFAGLGEAASRPLRTYSSGQKARLAFSVLTCLEPDILLLDEALATGDVGFAEKCKSFLRSLRSSGTTSIVAGHDLGFLLETCDHLLWLEQGRVLASGSPAEVVREYLKHLGHEVLHVSRPKNLLLRLTAPPGTSPALKVHCAEFLTGEEVVGSTYLGSEEVFVESTFAAREIGLAPGLYRDAWGPSVAIEGRGRNRVLTPSATDGVGYLALPMPSIPQPIPTSIQILAECTLEQPLELEVFVQGRIWPLGVVGGAQEGAQDVWRRDRFSLGDIFANLSPQAEGISRSVGPA